MSQLLSLCLFSSLTSLLAAAGVPSRWANRHAGGVRAVITGLLGLQAGLALWAWVGSLPALIATGQFPTLAWRWPAQSWCCSLSLSHDGLSSLLLLLVSSVGFVVAKYSIRYLDGEAEQGRYFCWVAMTVGAVSLLILAGNLLLLCAAWVLASLGLHQLLLFYPTRPAARRAAWTKFAVSRLGDIFLAAAAVLIWRQFGTFEFSEIFAALPVAPAAATSQQSAIAWLLVLAAVTKSAQFPCHTWLPATLEAPTPVSALMHAGIVNAGGYLVIRTSPLLVSTPLALVALAGIGTVTVCFAGVVMLTQTSIKRSLAYSTIAQMGFMMLQCGLGAFAVATLHMVAHSLYKAYAFLNSGSVLTEAVATKSRASCLLGRRVGVLPVLLGGLLAAASVVGVSWLSGVDLSAKPGGYALGAIVVLAIATWLWDTLQRRATTATGVLVAGLLAGLYFAAVISVETLVALQLAAVPPALWLVGSGAVLAFGVLAAVQLLLSSAAGRSWLAPFQVHASHGFYVDSWLRRFFQRSISASKRAA